MERTGEDITLSITNRTQKDKHDMCLSRPPPSSNKVDLKNVIISDWKHMYMAERAENRWDLISAHCIHEWK